MKKGDEGVNHVNVCVKSVHQKKQQEQKPRVRNRGVARRPGQLEQSFSKCVCSEVREDMGPDHAGSWPL